MTKKSYKKCRTAFIIVQISCVTLTLDPSKKGRGSEKAKTVRMVKIIRKSAEIKAKPKSCYVAN